MNFQHRQSAVSLTGWSAVIAVICLMVSFSFVSADEPNSNVPSPAEMTSTLQQSLDVLNRQIEGQPPTVHLYSKRGDLLFFLGRFPEAVADYQRMVEIDPELTNSHWRLGISLFYARQYSKAAEQFDRYHSFDNVDRENGIWRYFSHYKANGFEAARRQLLKYEKDDREPFGDVYRLFSGEMTSDQILQRIADADVTEEERNKRNFYAELYIGLNDALEGRRDRARIHLRKAVQNPWPVSSGYGPRYMWHVGRLHLELLDSED